jgi:hypothetical protein
MQYMGLPAWTTNERLCVLVKGALPNSSVNVNCCSFCYYVIPTPTVLTLKVIVIIMRDVK